MQTFRIGNLHVLHHFTIKSNKKSSHTEGTFSFQEVAQLLQLLQLLFLREDVLSRPTTGQHFWGTAFDKAAFAFSYEFSVR